MPSSSLAPLLLSTLLLSSCAALTSRPNQEALKKLEQEAYQAFRTNDLESFKKCFSRGLPINYGRGQETALHYVARTGNLDFTEWLLSRGADVNATDVQEYTPLHWSALRGHHEITKRLLDRNADPNARGGGGEMSRSFKMRQTPFHYAAARGPLESVQLMIASGGDVNARDFKDETPLLSALRKKKREIVDFLIGLNPEIDVQGGYDKRTPIMYAVLHGYIDIAEEFLRRGARVNVRETWEGNTPLHFAARTASKSLVTMMLDRGADLKAENKYGRTPLEEAEKFGITEIADMLREAVGKNERKKRSLP
jgi:ankyrin repeat protein